MIVSSESGYVGWVETVLGMHTFSIRPVTMGAHSSTTSAQTKLDLNSLSVDNELSVLLEGIKRKDWFIERLKSAKSPDVFARELQEMVTEVIDRHQHAVLRQSSSSFSASSSSSSSSLSSSSSSSKSATTAPHTGGEALSSLDAQSLIALLTHSGEGGTGGTAEKSLSRTLIKHIEALGWDNVVKVRRCHGQGF